MKRNISVFCAVIVLSLLLVYPLGRVFNLLFFHEVGGGLDIGLDTYSINILVGLMSVPPLLASLFLGIFGKNNWRWFAAFILSAPSVIFVFWLSIHKLVPFYFFLVGLVISLIINFFKNRRNNSVLVQ